MTVGGQPSGGSQDPRELDIQALRQEVEMLRKDMEQQETRLNARIDVLEERTSNVRTIVFAVIVALVVSVLGTLAVTLILRLAGLG
jgi:hypothetical protein